MKSRRRVHVGLNKGEAKNALAKAVFFNRLGEMRDRSFENQRYRASGLNLVVAAIIPWNTVYLERAIRCLKEHGLTSDDNLLQHHWVGNKSISRETVSNPGP
jgi:TnpA family transposase